MTPFNPLPKPACPCPPAPPQGVIEDGRPTIPAPPRCPPALASLINRCWAREPKERPQARQVLAELEDLLASLAGGGDGED